MVITMVIDLYGDKNNGTTYLPGYWYSVHDDLWNKENWTYEGAW